MPVPLSPVTSTVAGVCATSGRMSNISFMSGLLLTMSWKLALSMISLRRLAIICRASSVSFWASLIRASSAFFFSVTSFTCTRNSPSEPGVFSSGVMLQVK